ncbi:EamA family transporter [soil metagenome]
MSAAARASLIGLLCLIWGSTWLAIKIGLEGLPPFFGAAVRFASAAAILLALARVRKVPFPRSRRAHAGLLGLGLSSFWLSYGIVYWAEQYLTSGLTAVLFATLPLFTLLFAHGLIPAERITLRSAAGVVVGFLGVVVVFQSDLRLAHPMAPTAAAAVLLSPLASALGAVGIKRWAIHIHPYHLTILPMTYGAIGLFATSLFLEDAAAAEWSAAAIGSVLYLAIFGSVVAFVVYYTLLRQVAVTTLNLMSYVFPIVAVILGYLILGERLGPFALAGAALILIGIALATWRRRRPGVREEPL